MLSLFSVFVEYVIRAFRMLFSASIRPISVFIISRKKLVESTFSKLPSVILFADTHTSHKCLEILQCCSAKVTKTENKIFFQIIFICDFTFAFAMIIQSACDAKDTQCVAATCRTVNRILIDVTSSACPI